MHAVIKLTFIALTLGALSPAGHADSGDTAVKVRAGVAVAPVYPGALHYAALPLYDLSGTVRAGNLGTFSLGLIQGEGARWQLPLAGPVGVALLLDYDRGRKENIKTLGGHDTTLRGMGDLDGAVEGGLELSYRLKPMRLYMKGMRALKERDYGGSDLGYTTYLDVGGEGKYLLNPKLSLTMNAYLRWGDSGYEQGYFGVTRRQAEHTDYDHYSAGGGLQQVSAQAALNYQWTPNISFQSGVGVYRLTGDAADSPLVAKALAGMTFVSTSYQF